jgi:hypothetical protein
MYRLFIFSFLILITSASCTISKRQHLSGYHVDLHPALKKGPSNSEAKEAKEDRVIKDRGFSKENQPLLSLYPAIKAIEGEQYGLFQIPEEDAFPSKSPDSFNGTKNYGVEPGFNGPKKDNIKGESSAPITDSDDPKLHTIFFKTALILILVGALSLLLVFVLGPLALVLLFISIAAAIITLLIGIITYIGYSIKTESEARRKNKPAEPAEPASAKRKEHERIFTAALVSLALAALFLAIGSSLGGVFGITTLIISLFGLVSYSAYRKKMKI